MLKFSWHTEIHKPNQGHVHFEVWELELTSSANHHPFIKSWHPSVGFFPISILCSNCHHLTLYLPPLSDF